MIPVHPIEGSEEVWAHHPDMPGKKMRTKPFWIRIIDPTKLSDAWFPTDIIDEMFNITIRVMFVAEQFDDSCPGFSQREGNAGLAFGYSEDLQDAFKADKNFEAASKVLNESVGPVDLYAYPRDSYEIVGVPEYGRDQPTFER